MPNPATTRRFFLQSAGLAAGAALVPAALAAVPARAEIPAAAPPPAAASASDLPKACFQHGFAISVQAYTFRDTTTYEAIERAAQAGCSAIEFAFNSLSAKDPAKVGPGMNDDQIKALLEHLAKHKVKAAGLYTDIPQDEAAAAKLFAFAKKIGLYNLVTESAGSIGTIEKMVKEFDLHVGFHGHFRTADANYKLWNPQFVLDLVKDRDPRIGACGDVGHWASSGIRPLDAVKLLRGRMVSLHLKDRAEIGRRTTDLAACGSGVLEFPAVLKELRAQGFKGQVSIEYEEAPERNLPAVAQHAGFIRGVGAALEA